ncbi:MAG: tetratricopeptide repeat protein [Desulfobacterales bacterium]|nr:tetratricopeptide repeat protein [Desulfobacterales bacterium]
METTPEFYTRTMAKVYADQGHYDKAAEIYRHLVEKEPHRYELKAELADLEMILAQIGTGPARDLTPLFRQWFDLIGRYNSVQRLKRLRRT